MDDGVAGAIDALAFLPGVTAEEEEDHAAALCIDAVDDGVGELLPALVGVGSWLGGAYGEDGVEEEGALTGPGHEVAVVRRGRAGIVVELAEKVPERRGWGDAGSHGEREAVGLAGLVVGVLSEEHGADGAERGEAEGLEDLAGRRVDGCGGVLAGEERVEVAEVRLRPLAVQNGPAAGDGREDAGRRVRSYGRPPGRRREQARAPRPDRRGRARRARAPCR